MIVDWPGLAFYLPPDFGNASNTWAFRECEYEVLDSRTYNDVNGIMVTDYSIEQRCSDSEFITRYLFSDIYGLQSFAFGVYEAEANGDREFNISAGFVLWAHRNGFGAPAD